MWLKMQGKVYQLAKMVKNRSVSKNLYQKYDDLSSKIKNLVEAAKNSK